MRGSTCDPHLPESLTRAESLPSLPAVAVEVMRLAEREDCSIEELAGCLRRDPALAAKLLKVANSSLFNPGHPVTTLERAAIVLGSKTVKLMSLSFSLAAALPREGGGAFDYAGFWRRSLTAAVAARSLARLGGRASASEELFLCGLLSHLGQLVLHEVLGEEYAAVLERSGGAWPTRELEREVLGFGGDDVTDALLASWGLPESVRVPLRLAAGAAPVDDEDDPELRRSAEVLLATRCVVALLCDARRDALSGLHEAAARLGIEAADVEAALLLVEDGVGATAETLSLDLPPGTDARAILEAARMQVVRISLDATASLASIERRASDLESRNEALRVEARTDRLTGLPNRAAFDEMLRAEVERRASGGVPRSLGVVMIDVDRFKRFNDTHGHRAGDEVLRAVGRVLRDCTRKSDLAARYGGEEFALVLPSTTPAAMRAVAERVRLAVEATEVEFEGKTLRVTASFGGACVERTQAAEDADRLVELADGRLYAAKAGGRNRVEIRSRTRLSA